MPLDSNLFTLSIAARSDASGIIDLGDDSLIGSAVYSAIKDGEKLRLIDPFTEAVLASTSVVGPKSRLVELNEPTQVIEIKSTGSLSWQWSFSFEEKVELSLKREIVSVGSERGYIISLSRKPDPDWPVLIYKPATSKKKATFQCLDFNFQRLDYRIQDSKGLEILMITTVLSFLDNLWPTSSSPLPTPTSLPQVPTSIPIDSPSPALDKVARRMSSLDLANNKGKETGNIGGKESASKSSLSANEIVITDKSNASDLTSRILKLLSDESLMYVVLLAKSASSSQLAVRIAEESKRKHYKSTGEELKQYVLPDSEKPASSSSDKKFAATSNIKIYISRLSLDELLPTYKKKAPAFKPRPPIVLDSPSKPLVEAHRPDKIKKPSGKVAEEPTAKKSGWGFFS